MVQENTKLQDKEQENVSDIADKAEVNKVFTIESKLPCTGLEIYSLK